MISTRRVKVESLPLNSVIKKLDQTVPVLEMGFATFSVFTRITSK